MAFRYALSYSGMWFCMGPPIRALNKFQTGTEEFEEILVLWLFSLSYIYPSIYQFCIQLKYPLRLHAFIAKVRKIRSSDIFVY